jgi:hypothetical protein
MTVHTLTQAVPEFAVERILRAWTTISYLLLLLVFSLTLLVLLPQMLPKADAVKQPIPMPGVRPAPERYIYPVQPGWRVYP